MSIDRQWHVERSRQILEAHPEIKQYFGNYSWSIVPIIFLVILQWFCAWLVKDLPWWAIGLIAFFWGQFVLHSLSVFIHEAAHNLVLKGKWGNIFTLFLIELGSLSFGKSLTYVGKHGKSHHKHLNDYEQDYEWFDQKQAYFRSHHQYFRLAESIVHLLPGGVAIAELLVDWLIPTEPRPIPSSYQPRWFKICLIATSIILYSLAWYVISWQAAVYLFWSLTLMVSNWGISFKGQSIAEHHLQGEGKTYSTYSWTNLPFFNTGYHDEHHTFANVPWIHLPKIKQVAPEYFTNDNPHSYFYLWWLWAKSIFQPALYNRYEAESHYTQDLQPSNIKI